MHVSIIHIIEPVPRKRIFVNAIEYRTGYQWIVGLGRDSRCFYWVS